MIVGSRTPIPNFKRETIGYWKSDTLLECSAINDETNDVRSYSFKDPKGGGFNFKPGQHISLLLPLDGGDEYRTFTICSSPTYADDITLTVKTNRPDGATAWMRKNIDVGYLMSAVGPTGHFNLADYPCEKLVLISGGSGITPMMSMLRWLNDRNDEIDITFIHYARTSDEFLFSDELNEIAKENSNLRLYQIPTDEKKGKVHGIPTEEQLGTLIDVTDQQVFCCGPAGFMDLVKSILFESGLAPANYHQESFGGEKQDANSALPENLDDSGGTVSVTFKDRTFNAPKGSNLLNALKSNKFVIPTGCKSGMCGTCQVTVESGDVKMDQQGGLSNKEMEKGIVLACCSTIESNLILS